MLNAFVKEFGWYQMVTLVLVKVCEWFHFDASNCIELSDFFLVIVNIMNLPQNIIKYNHKWIPTSNEGLNPTAFLESKKWI